MKLKGENATMDVDTEAQFAGTFGMSSGEFMRELEAEWEQATPEQRAGFEQLVDQANVVFPIIHGTLSRIEDRLADTRSSIAELKSTMETSDARLINVERKFSDPAPAMKVGCI